MVTNKWMKLPVKNPNWDEQNDLVWYYFSNSGKAVTDGWSKIDGKYYFFDSEGIMQTGWVDDDTYYLGEDGAIRIRTTIPLAMRWFRSEMTRTAIGTIS